MDCNDIKIDDFIIFYNTRKYNMLPGSGTYLTLGAYSEVRDNDLGCFVRAVAKQTLDGDSTIHMFLFARFKHRKTDFDL